MAPAVSLFEVVLAVHVVAVVAGFGVTFAYPILVTAIARADSRALPALHRAQHAVGTRLISPALAVVVACGIYLASEMDAWGTFYVQWGLGASVVLGALGGMFFAPTERRLSRLAARDVAACAGAEAVVMSEEYEALSRRLAMGGAFGSLLVLVTVFLMAVRAGG
ncbi:MAG: hypothetical protein KGJ43_04085 [Acidobacteriota bacterium]|nr:hypothetical protein [Acidobacteriota bacterium]